MDLPETLPLVAWVTVHVGGIVAAVLSRLQIGAGLGHTLQCLTAIGFLSIALLAASALLTGGDQLRLVVLSAGSLGTMVVASVVEARYEPADPTLAAFLRSQR
ncbi:MAG: hypothetical protein AAF790_06870 [Planctomycetota bacterium]